MNLNPELDLGLDDLGRAGDPGDLLQPLVRNRDAADVRLDRAEGIVGRLCSGSLGQRVEEGGLADVRQAHDAAFETHSLTPAVIARRVAPRRSSGAKLDCFASLAMTESIAP